MKIMSLAFAGTMVVCLSSSTVAQITDTPNPDPAAANAPAASSSDQATQPADPSVAIPPETEAQRRDRVAKIEMLQGQLDHCNHTFMGLPKEHEKCIQRIRDQIAGKESGGDINTEEEGNE